MGNAKKCIEAMNKKIAVMEHRSVRIKGETLSRSDVETVKMYAEIYVRNNGMSWGGLREPDGSIGNVLTAFGVKVENAFAW